MQRLRLLLFFLSLLSLKSIASELPDKLVFAALPQYLERHHAGQFEDNIVMQLGEKLGVEVELYSCPWVRCLKLIETGQADIIDDLFITKERATYINYLRPAFDKQTTGFRYYSIHENITTFADLNGKTVGYLRGHVHYDKFEAADNFTKVSLLVVEDLVNMMLAERIDVFIAPPSFDLSSFTHVDTQQRIKQQPYEVAIDMPLFLGVSRKSDWTAYSSELEKAMLEILSAQQ
ncbi:transporter substrate-binding domain-containing protein [Alteromonas sp. KUL49]|uniref:substrate-binding periplasmic protein n=1 Tax=Alteromonas sp. KUL49 TaxID=2480798 RepID=UPI00102EDD93|nr:transporter substrate-binding domain-containing protein [Alteromonas sp. KUL49]TAP40669.1 transporter substrate-binding domain-containing protein [Alteromonas sp. KUL49]